MRHLFLAGIALSAVMLVGVSRAVGPLHSSAAPRSAPLYVSVTGSDDGTCTKSAPCASFDRAYHVAKPGQIVLVAAGTYPAQTILADSTKRAPNVEIRAAPGAIVNIDSPAGGIAISLGRNSDDPGSASPSFLTIAGVHAIGGLRQWSGSTRQSFQAHSITIKNSSFADVRSRLGPLITFTFVDGLKVLNNEIGPVCCGTDGLNLANSGVAGTDPSNVLIDHNYVHDITQDCSTNPDPSCTNSYNCPANTAQCDHPDGSQFFGVKGLTMSNNRYYNAGTQNIFLQSANGGVFSNLTFSNNMVAATAGRGVTNSVSLSGPGRGVFSGYVKFLNNTFQRGLVIYDSSPRLQVVAPGTQIAIEGNIFGYVGSDTAGSRCTVVASDGSPIQPHYAYNLIGNKTCAGSDRRGSASFLATDPLHPDLHLARRSFGVGLDRRPTSPRFDLDGDLRPTRSADIGADQRETAQVIRGRSIGAARLGSSEADIRAFYGDPPRLRFRNGRLYRVATYRLHNGTLTVVYRGTSVAAVGTTSRFYVLSTRLHVGAKISLARSLGSMRWTACRGAMAVGSDGRLFLAPAGGRLGRKIASLWILPRASDACRVPTH